MRRFTRRGVSPVIATVMMVVITIILSSVVVVMVMSFNSSGSVTHYGSFAMVEKNAADKYTLTFGTFTPKTRFSEVKVSIAGQLTGALSSYPSAAPYSSTQVASMYYIDLGADGSINVGDTLVVTFTASMAGKVVDVLIVFSADGNVVADTTLVVGSNPTPPPIAADFTYSTTVNGGKATISAYTGPGGAITIPSTDRGGIRNGVVITASNQVTVIGNGAFNNANGRLVTSVTIPSSIQTIWGQSFQNCIALTSVTIPNTVISMGDNAFNGCTALASAVIGSGVTTIGNSAFNGCTALTSVTIGSGVTTILGASFQGCTALTSVTIPNGVTSIGLRAFRSCSALTAITIGSGVTTIGNEAFKSCLKLTSITFRELAAPTAGTDWILGTSASINGHRLAEATGFPVSGGSFTGGSNLGLVTYANA